jgi:hypothetical protein
MDEKCSPMAVLTVLYTGLCAVASWELFSSGAKINIFRNNNQGGVGGGVMVFFPTKGHAWSWYSSRNFECGVVIQPNQFK